LDIRREGRAHSLAWRTALSFVRNFALQVIVYQLDGKDGVCACERLARRGRQARVTRCRSQPGVKAGLSEYINVFLRPQSSFVAWHYLFTRFRRDWIEARQNRGSAAWLAPFGGEKASAARLGRGHYLKSVRISSR